MAQIWLKANIWAGHHSCHHNDILTHTSFLPQFRIRTSYMLSFTPFSDRHVTLVSSPKNDQPGTPSACQPDIAVVWARVWATVWGDGSVCFLAILIFVWSRSCYAQNNKLLHKRVEVNVAEIWHAIFCISTILLMRLQRDGLCVCVRETATNRRV